MSRLVITKQTAHRQTDTGSKVLLFYISYIKVILFYIGILQPFVHLLFFVQYLFEAFAIVDFYVLLYHAFC